ncbi:MAG TPA: glycosyltransferase [Pseudorhodoplanes sp.]|nr:glycosyltransferase [Pseudorhodoplanes sp.]
MIAAYHPELLDYRGGADLELTAAGFLTRGVSPAGELQRSPAQFRLSLGPSRLRGPLPLISCLMPTKNRFEQVKLAVHSFRVQTWPNKELVVIDQNHDGCLAAWLQSLNDPSIRVYRMPGLREPLGMIRNRSIGLAAGGLLCNWDDDDLQHPARLEIAATAMTAAKAALCLLDRQTIWGPIERRVAVTAPDRVCTGSVLVTRSAGLWYVATSLGEDIPAVGDLLRRFPAVMLDLPELYVRIVHGHNTCAPQYLEGRWRTATELATGHAAQEVLAQLSEVYPVAEYAAAVRSEMSPAVAQPA